MIYTITVNPALDYVLNLDRLDMGMINRTKQASFLAGGKGINVSQILTQLQVDNTVWGFVGGFTGKELVRQLNKKRIANDMVTISDTTRINVKLAAQQETEVNTVGPQITDQEITAFKARFNDLKAGDIVIMSGSLAPSLPADFYQQLLPMIKSAGAEFVVDTRGKALLNTLSAHPLLIKPNLSELAEISEERLSSADSVIKAAKKLQELGAQNVMVSLASRGGYLLTPEHLYFAPAAIGMTVNSVGAGDSMLAGFVASYVNHQDPEAAFKLGMAAGGATAFCHDIAVKSQIDVVLDQIKVEKIY